MLAGRGRLIKGGIAAFLAFVVAAGVAQADPRDRRGRDFGRGDGRGYEQQQARPDRESQRAQRGEEQRQRLSPEERRQLRRDVQDAGRELYPPRR